MIFINLNLFNSIDNTLKNFSKSIDLNSIIKNFSTELSDYLEKYNSYELSKNLHWHTSLHFIEYDKDFAKCIEYNSKKIYYLPRNSIEGNKPNPGEALKISSPREILCRLYWNSYS